MATTPKPPSPSKPFLKSRKIMEQFGLDPDKVVALNIHIRASKMTVTATLEGDIDAFGNESWVEYDLVPTGRTREAPYGNTRRPA